MKPIEIEITVNCYECSPRQFNDAIEKLDAAFKRFDTKEFDCVKVPDFNPYGKATITLFDIPEEELDWAEEQIDDAMEDIPAWSSE